MLLHYLNLNISPDASDREIREAYLRMVKKHPPEREPVRFQEITKAYEALKDRRNRVRSRLFISQLMGADYEKSLLELSSARKIRRRRVGLSDLVEAARGLHGDS